MRTLLSALLLALLAALLAGPGRAQAPVPGPVPDPAPSVLVLDVEGPIGPATALYLRQGLDAAAARGAALVVIRLDTPGGLVETTREIVRMILASPVPVATYVAPSGARAASAGTYILYASHLAAMAPGTNLGAATPIPLAGPSQPRGDGAQDGEAPLDAAGAKAVNDAVASIRALADLHGRDADWAEAAVREAASLTAAAALDRGVIEILAPDLAGLLAAADGRAVRLGGREAVLRTAGIEVVEQPPDWRARILAVITNPNLAYILLLVGIYGIVFEFVTPGTVGPGVIGAIALVTALYALNLLPINLAGAGLLLLGVALMTAEAFVPSFGVLGIGGFAAFGMGSLFLFEEVPGFALSPGVVAAAALASAALLVVMLASVVRAHRRRVASGDPAMIGAPGRVLSWSGERGFVEVQGERWQARSKARSGARPDDASPDARPAPGAPVRVLAREGLTLLVEPQGSPRSDPRSAPRSAPRSEGEP